MNWDVLVDVADNNKLIGMGHFPDYPSPNGDIHKLVASWNGGAQRDILHAINVDTGAGTCNLEKKPYYVLTLTDISDGALPDTGPEDNVGEVVGDGAITFKLKIQKKSGVDDSDMTTADDDDDLNVWTLEGVKNIDDSAPSLVNGYHEAIITAKDGLGLSTLRVKDQNKLLELATIRVQFV